MPLKSSQLFASAFGGILVVLIILFATCTKYEDPIYEKTGTGTNMISGVAATTRLSNYSTFQDVNVMIFVGFAFLMSFLDTGSFTATGHPFILAVFTLLWGILNRGFWERAIGHVDNWNAIPLNISSFLGGEFCIAAILISFGAVLGRVTIAQGVLMAGFEVIFFSINEVVLFEHLGVADIGGVMVIHMFGAYFGLAFSWILEVGRQDRKEKSREFNKPSHVSDTMAMVGTLFLFCFWPSFNAVLASGLARERAIINTIISLCSATMVAYIVSMFVYDGKVSMTVVQNSTLAGGVAMGAAADMYVTPYGALIAGAICGAVSVVGYRFLTPALEKAGVCDTCGVNNLHGVPSIVGAIVAVICAATAETDEYKAELFTIFKERHNRSASKQAGFQVAALFTTLGISIASGLLVGFLARLLPSLEQFFRDEEEYVVEEEEEEGEGESKKKVKEMKPVEKKVASKDPKRVEESEVPQEEKKEEIVEEKVEETKEVNGEPIEEKKAEMDSDLAAALRAKLGGL